MNQLNNLQHKFPVVDGIPESVRLPSQIHQRVSLVDGELKLWAGATKKTLSPIWIQQPDGSLQQVELGSYPVMGEKESDEALEAAVRAYNNGRGEWPMMKVGERIACMQNFIQRMVEQRDLIIKLIMWEIGKSLADSEKEFDRTITYMRQTIDALKDLDNANSRFVIAEGTIGQIRRTPLGVVLCMGPYNYPLNETFATLIPAMLMVHRSIADEFVNRLTAELAKLKVGMPWEKGVFITPLPGMHRTAYMTEVIEDAVAKGAKVVNPEGGEFCKTMFYPAVVYPVTEGMRLYREEQFGPVVPVAVYDDIETVLEYVTTSDHGQQVSIFGSDPEQIGHLVDPLVHQVCRVNINCQCQRGPDVFPFGGRKDSAEGTLSVHDALRAFSIRSMIAAKQTDDSKGMLASMVSEHYSKFVNTDFIF
ncbi:aldehyde dehydrogenase family protein [Acinetobacter pittii]|uniref:aldehyde dehydrogenase family protein n=1 Tax=Acinetobacter pittii TaxID=48296 RepID=UPI0021CD5DAC|nr:aldehyde dehydrogenase family protein [Acinetobacter pittii]MCU4708571.1 aldehyde dehydrogenase family protein [Acinetobacter pittii]